MLFFTKVDKTFYYGVVFLLFGLGFAHWLCRLFDQDETIKCYLPQTSSKNFQEYIKARLKTFDFQLYPASHNMLYNTAVYKPKFEFKTNSTYLIQHFKGFEFLSTILFVCGIIWCASLYGADILARLFKMNTLVNFLDQIVRHEDDYHQCKKLLYKTTMCDIIVVIIGIFVPRLFCFAGYLLILYTLSNYTNTYWGIDYKTFFWVIFSANWWPTRYTGKLSTTGAIGHSNGLIDDPLPFNVIAEVKLRMKEQTNVYSFECATKSTNVVMYGKNILYTAWTAIILFFLLLLLNLLMEVVRLIIAMLKGIARCDSNDAAFRLPYLSRVVMNLTGHSTKMQSNKNHTAPPTNQNNLFNLDQIIAEN